MHCKRYRAFFTIRLNHVGIECSMHSPERHSPTPRRSPCRDCWPRKLASGRSCTRKLHRSAENLTTADVGLGLDFFIGGIGNARWGGTSLASVLRRSAPGDRAVEVVFWGEDSGQVTIRDDSGITGPGVTGTVVPDATNGLDLTITEQFARSMTLADAMSPDNILCYEMNGVSLPPDHGFPLRLIAPGWYGVANVKWLTRIELRDGRYAGRFMARDYVTIREEEQDGKTVWTFTNVSHGRLKSAPAKVTRRGAEYFVLGAAWGGSIERVEVQVDNGVWQRTSIKRMRSQGDKEFSWSFWTFDWRRALSGRHTIRSRAFGDHAAVQPAPEDPYLASRRTYWLGEQRTDHPYCRYCLD